MEKVQNDYNNINSRRRESMSLVRCENGHFYDNTKFKQCPHCGRNTKDRSDWTIPLFGKRAGKQQKEADREQNSSTVSEENENLTLPEQVAKAYMEKGKAPISVKTFYAKEVSDEMLQEEDGEILHTVSRGKYIAGWLVCIKGNSYGESFNVYVGENKIGRGDRMDIVLRGDRYISREDQAILIYNSDNNKFFVKPGTARELFYLNDKVVLKETEIRDGDIINIGFTDLVFKAFCGENFNWNERESR